MLLNLTNAALAVNRKMISHVTRACDRPHYIPSSLVSWGCCCNIADVRTPSIIYQAESTWGRNKEDSKTKQTS